MDMNIILFAASCFGAGMLASLTPCVYPVIPLIIGFIGTNAKNWKEVFLYSLGFILGLSSVYTGLGLLAGLAGVFLGKWAGSPWIYLFMSGVCFIGAFHYWDIIKLPFLRFSQKVEEELGFIESLILGAGAGIMATACSTPIVLTILSYIAGKQMGPVLGAVLLFIFSLGMGSVYLLISVLVGAMKSVPRPGNWMNLIYSLFAWLLFLLGVYFTFRAGRLW